MMLFVLAGSMTFRNDEETLQDNRSTVEYIRLLRTRGGDF